MTFATMVRDAQAASRAIWRVIKNALHPCTRYELMSDTRDAFQLWNKLNMSTSAAVADRTDLDASLKLRYLQYCSRYSLYEAQRERRKDQIFGYFILLALTTWTALLLWFLNLGIITFLLAALVAAFSPLLIAPFVLYATATSREWVVYLIGLLLNLALGIITSMPKGNPLGHFFIPPAEIRQLGLVEATFYINSYLLFIGVAVSAACRITINFTSRRILLQQADVYIAVSSLEFVSYMDDESPTLHRQTRRYAGFNAACLEFLADLVRNYPRSAKPVWSSSGKSELQDRLSSCSRALLKQARAAAVANVRTQEDTVATLKRLSVSFTLGMYDYLPNFNEEEEPSRARRLFQSFGRYFLGLSVALLPITFLLLAPRLGITIPDATKSWFGLFCIIWAMLRLISLLDPNYRATLTSARDVIADIHSGAEKTK